MTRRSDILFLLILLCVSLPLQAQRQPLDDSLSPRRNFSLDLKWNAQEMSRAISAMINDNASALPPLTGRLANVETRLDTRDFVDQNVRIYLRLPITYAGTHSPQNMSLSWETRGQFLSGSVRPGQSTLIFNGRIEQTVTTDVFNYTVSVEHGDIPDSFILETEYEIEITP